MPEWLPIVVMIVVVVVGRLAMGTRNYNHESIKKLENYFKNDLNRWHTYDEIKKAVEVGEPLLGWLLYQFYKRDLLFRQLDERLSHVNTLTEDTSAPPESANAHHFEYRPNGPELLAFLARSEVKW